MQKLIIGTAVIITLSACSIATQTTSGKSYLQKYKNVPTVAVGNTDKLSIEEQIRQVASVEPILTFPARIGIARIEQGDLSAMPGEEMEIWNKTRDKLGKDFGEFIPLSPLVATMVTQSVANEQNTPITDVMNKIRLGAARQHLDAVLIYEVYSKNDTKSNLLAIANLTIIGGYILPSQSVTAEGYANALLIDVVQGYPYGTAETLLDKEEMLTTSWGSFNREKELTDKVKTKTVTKLSTEVEEMFKKLRYDLAVRQK